MFGYESGFDLGTSPYTHSPPLFLNGNPTNISGPDAVSGAQKTFYAGKEMSASAYLLRVIRRTR